MSQWWSWGLVSFGGTCLFLVSRKSTRTIGWAGGMVVQVAWAIYGIVTRQWGFLASAFLYGAMYGKNLAAWRKESHPEAETP